MDSSGSEALLRDDGNNNMALWAQWVCRVEDPYAPRPPSFLEHAIRKYEEDHVTSLHDMSMTGFQRLCTKVLFDCEQSSSTTGSSMSKMDYVLYGSILWTMKECYPDPTSSDSTSSRTTPSQQWQDIRRLFDNVVAPTKKNQTESEHASMLSWLLPSVDLDEIEEINSMEIGRGLVDNSNHAMTEEDATAFYRLIQFWKALYVQCQKRGANADPVQDHVVKRQKLIQSRAMADSNGRSKENQLYQSNIGNVYYDKDEEQEDAQSGAYKIPVAIVLSYLFLEKVKRMEDVSSDLTAETISQDKSMWQMVHSQLMSALFKNFKTVIAEEGLAGLAVLGMHIQKTQPSSPIDGLTSLGILNDYLTPMGECVFSLIHRTLGLNTYPTRASICEHLTETLLHEHHHLSDVDCRKLLMACVGFLNKEDRLGFVKEYDTRKRRRRDATSVCLVPNRLTTVQYPILTHLAMWDFQENRWEMNRLVRSLEKTGTVNEELIELSYKYLWRNLLNAGIVFVDGNRNIVANYDETREYLFYQVATGMGPCGLNYMKDFYTELANHVWELPGHSRDEREYVVKACQVTLLRLLFKHAGGFGDHPIRQYLQEEHNWPIGLEGTSSLTTSPELTKWAADFLKKVPFLPPSLCEDIPNSARKSLRLSHLVEGYVSDPPPLSTEVDHKSNDQESSIMNADTQSTSETFKDVNSPLVEKPTEADEGLRTLTEGFDHSTEGQEDDETPVSDSMREREEDDDEDSVVLVVDSDEKDNESVAGGRLEDDENATGEFDPTDEEEEVLVPDDDSDNNTNPMDESDDDFAEEMGLQSPAQSDFERVGAEHLEDEQGTNSRRTDGVEVGQSDEDHEASMNEADDLGDPNGTHSSEEDDFVEVDESKPTDKGINSMAKVDSTGSVTNENTQAQPAEKVDTEVAADGGEFGDTTEEEEDDVGTRANLLADADRRADVRRATPGYSSQIEDGYEPEDTHTEEEVSEAIPTEDEEEENRLAEETPSKSEDVTEAKPTQAAADGLHSHLSDDMDADDEHTEHEEDLGAESSELEDPVDAPSELEDPVDAPSGERADSAPPKTSESGTASTALWQYARTAQLQQTERDDFYRSKLPPEQPKTPTFGEEDTTGAEKASSTKKKSQTSETLAADEKDAESTAEMHATDEHSGNYGSIEDHEGESTIATDTSVEAANNEDLHGQVTKVTEAEVDDTEATEEVAMEDAEPSTTMDVDKDTLDDMEEEATIEDKDDDMVENAAESEVVDSVDQGSRMADDSNEPLMADEEPEKKSESPDVVGRKPEAIPKPQSEGVNTATEENAEAGEEEEEAGENDAVLVEGDKATPATLKSEPREIQAPQEEAKDEESDGSAASDGLDEKETSQNTLVDEGKEDDQNEDSDESDLRTKENDADPGKTTLSTTKSESPEGLSEAEEEEKEETNRPTRKVTRSTAKKSTSTKTQESDNEIEDEASEDEEEEKEKPTRPTRKTTRSTAKKSSSTKKQENEIEIEVEGNEETGQSTEATGPPLPKSESEESSSEEEEEGETSAGVVPTRRSTRTRRATQQKKPTARHSTRASTRLQKTTPQENEESSTDIEQEATDEVSDKPQKKRAAKKTANTTRKAASKETASSKTKKPAAAKKPAKTAKATRASTRGAAASSKTSKAKKAASPPTRRVTRSSARK